MDPATAQERGHRATADAVEPKSAPGARWQAALLGVCAVLLLGAAALLLFTGGGEASDATAEAGSSDEPTELRPGQQAGLGDPLPHLELSSHGGGMVDLAESIPGPGVINYFASWCAPCVAEMPRFEEVHSELGDEVAFLGVAATDDAESEQELIARTGITYPTVRDPMGDSMYALGVLGLPSTIFVDREGRIAHQHVGELDADELRRLIREHALG